MVNCNDNNNGCSVEPVKSILLNTKIMGKGNTIYIFAHDITCWNRHTNG